MVWFIVLPQGLIWRGIRFNPVIIWYLGRCSISHEGKVPISCTYGTGAPGSPRSNAWHRSSSASFGPFLWRLLEIWKSFSAGIQCLANRSLDRRSLKRSYFLPYLETGCILRLTLIIQPNPEIGSMGRLISKQSLRIVWDPLNPPAPRAVRITKNASSIGHWSPGGARRGPLPFMLGLPNLRLPFYPDL